MFRHQGKTRTLNHNKKIASLLSFVAGMVNVASFLSVNILTTNVTGHFAFFVDEVFKLKLTDSIIYFLFIFAFFLGSFVSSFLAESLSKKSDKHIYLLPVLIESCILLLIAWQGENLIPQYANGIALCLLFAMGIQNSLVTRISDALVRTTHLTGLFTDLGIELSQLFFYKTFTQRIRLLSSIKLRLRIIVWFFLGGIFGGVFYAPFQLHILFVPALLLLFGLFYDALKYKVLSWRRAKIQAN